MPVGVATVAYVAAVVVVKLPEIAAGYLCHCLGYWPGYYASAGRSVARRIIVVAVVAEGVGSESCSSSWTGRHWFRVRPCRESGAPVRLWQESLDPRLPLLVPMMMMMMTVLSWRQRQILSLLLLSFLRLPRCGHAGLWYCSWQQKHRTLFHSSTKM